MQLNLCILDFDQRKKDVDDFNNNNRWQKRGIAITTMKWALSYHGNMPAYVAIYHRDGTVVVSHGGVECGQGINTKVAQVAAYALGLPLEMISIKPTNNVIGANAVLTGSSCTSEMVCYVSCIHPCTNIPFIISFIYFYLDLKGC